MEYPFKSLMPLDEATARDGYYKDWTHIDADTFHQISELVKFIREKGYGADTREAIAQALERVYHDAAMSGNANMEVSRARKHFKDLASRLDASDDKLTSATAQLAQKIRKGEPGTVSWGMIDQNAKAQFAGDLPPAIVGPNSVGEEEVIDESLGLSKLKRELKGTHRTNNLLNWAEITTGGYYDRDRQWVSDNGYAQSPIMRIEPRVTYTLFPRGNHVQYYDQNGNFLEAGGVANGRVNELTVTNPNIYYLSYIVDPNNPSMFIRGKNYPNKYIPYLEEHIQIKNNNIEDKAVGAEKLAENITETVVSRNLLDYSKITKGGYYDNNGNWITNEKYAQTPLIPVETSKYYTFYPTGNHVQHYDSKGELFESSSVLRRDQVNTYRITNPAIAYISYIVSPLHPSMMVEGFEYPKTYIEHIDHEISLGGVSSFERTSLLSLTNIEDGGYYSRLTGEWIEDSSYVSTDFIQIEHGVTYTSDRVASMTYWEADKSFESGTGAITNTIKNERLKYVRLNIRKEDLMSAYFDKSENFKKRYKTKKGFVIEGLLNNDNSDTKHRANANKPLVTPTYDGSGQSVHPKVIHLPETFSGYAYWMAMTPYTYTDDKTENPSILASHDGVHWEEPSGINNPISGIPNPGGGGHYSDTHLLIVNGNLECWYRYNPPGSNGQGNDNRTNIIYRQKSTDGVNWSEKEEMFHETTIGDEYASPSIIYEDNKYKIWWHDYSGGTYFQESSDGQSWTEKADVSVILPTDVWAWHSDVIKTELGYEMVISCGKRGQSRYYDLYYTFSKDGINFKPAKQILIPTDDISRLDNKGIYRASILKVNGQYRIYYSANSMYYEWHIFLSEGVSPYSLVGVNL